MTKNSSGSFMDSASFATRSIETRSSAARPPTLVGETVFLGAGCLLKKVGHLCGGSNRRDHATDHAWDIVRFEFNRRSVYSFIFIFD